MLRAVLFDLGGTLLQYESTELSYMELHCIGLRGIYEYLARNGHDLPSCDDFCRNLYEHTEAQWRRSLASMEGLSTEDILREIFGKMNIDWRNIDMEACLWAFYRPMAPHIRPYEGAYETLAHLREEGLRIGLISNTVWPGALHNEDLSRFDLLRFFDHLTYSSATRHAKPHPEIFLQTLRALGVRPEEAAFVGDRLYDDISGAQRVGMKGILKIVPHREEENDTIRPDAQIRTLDELPEVLRQLF